MKNSKDSKISSFKKWMRENQNSSNILIRKIINVLYLFVQFLYNIKAFLFNKTYRSIIFIKILNKKSLHQTSSDTDYNRYPIIFSASQQYFNKKENIKILSFGCSTGEEVVTLRKYFPNATIVGADINQHSLELCKKRNLDEKIHFIKSTTQDLQKFAPYDAIFCMAVFQRTPSLIYKKQITDLKKIYPFERFEKQVVELDQYIKEKGLFIIHCSQYYLKDTSIANKYEPFKDYNQDGYTWPIFDKNSKLIKQRTKRYCIFIKK